MPWVYLPGTEHWEKDAWLETTKGSDHLGKTIYEPEGKPVDTGLLDRLGRKIMKTEQRERIGFRK